MNLITEKLTTPCPAAALHISHEQACMEITFIKDIASELLIEGVNLPNIANRLQRSANTLATCCENIYKLSHADKLASMAHVEKLATEWMTLAKNAIKAIKDIEEKM